MFNWEYKFDCATGKWGLPVKAIPIPQEETKSCKLCGQVKSVKDFYFSVKATAKRMNKCKKCHDSTDRYRLNGYKRITVDK